MSARMARPVGRFGQSHRTLQLAAETLAPMAQVRAFVRKLVLEELLSGEVLEVCLARFRATQ